MTLNPNDPEETNPVETANEEEVTDAASQGESPEATEEPSEQPAEDPEVQPQPAVEPAAVAKAKSGVSGKVIAAVVVIALLGVGALVWQYASSRSRTVKLTA